MAILATCQCGAKFRAKAELAGKQVNCPTCGQSFRVPLPDPIRVTCQCGQAFHAEHILFGKTVQCPACQQPLSIPESDDPQPAAKLPPPSAEPRHVQPGVSQAPPMQEWQPTRPPIRTVRRRKQAQSLKALNEVGNGMATCGCLLTLFVAVPVLFLMFLVSGNGGDRGVRDAEKRTPPQKQTVPSPIPKDVSYKIIDQNIVPGIKRSLDIRLNKKVSGDVLKSIAMKLKNSDSTSYERTFIGYYLPGMEINAGYWATSHFNPNLEIRVLGLTIGQEKSLKHQADNTSREVVGHWIDERPFLEKRISIFRQNDKLYMEITYKDGSSGKNELLETRSPLGRRFEKVGVSRASDHWILDSDGNLQLRDNEGLIATSKKI